MRNEVSSNGIESCYIYLLEEVNIVIQHICANEPINKSEVCKISIVLYNEFNVYQTLYYIFNIIMYLNGIFIQLTLLITIIKNTNYSQKEINSILI